jgi:hypothetical protein
VAEAIVYGGDGRRYAARLRQLSNSADVHTRTYEAVNGAAIFLKSGAAKFPSLAGGDQPWA